MSDQRWLSVRSETYPAGRYGDSESDTARIKQADYCNSAQPRHHST